MTTEIEDRMGALEAEVAALKAEISSLANAYSSIVSGVRRGVLEGVAPAEQAMELGSSYRAKPSPTSRTASRPRSRANALRDRVDGIDAR